MADNTHYDTLYILPDAPLEVIRAAFRALARLYHPDINPGKDDLMQAVNIAHRVLSASEKKAAYDANIGNIAMGPLKEARDRWKKELSGWLDTADRPRRELLNVQERLQKAADMAGRSIGTEKAKWIAAIEQATDELTVAEKKLAEAEKNAHETIAVLMQKSEGVLTHYDSLSLKNDAPTEVVRAVAKALMEESKTASPTLIRLAENVLSDPQKRQTYDAWLLTQNPKLDAPAAEKPKTAGTTSAAPATPAAPAASHKPAPNAEKAKQECAALQAWAKQAAETAAEARAKANKAMADAKAKAVDKDAATWIKWAEKLAYEADLAEKQAKQAKDRADAAERTL